MTTHYSFANYPQECQYDDGRIAEMSLADLQKAFEMAENLLPSTVFQDWCQTMWLAIERVRSNATNAQLQNIVYHLEERKRTLGRIYDDTVHKYGATSWLADFQAFRYNSCELDIRWLVEQFELKRSTSRHLIHVRVYNI